MLDASSVAPACPGQAGGWLLQLLPFIYNDRDDHSENAC